MDAEFEFNTFLIRFYNYLKANNKFNLKQPFFENFKTVCINFELEIEKSVQKIDTEWLEFMKSIKGKNISFIAVSDFYLPKDALIELFRFHGIEQYFDTIFVSSDYLLTKRSGRLYKEILKNINFSSEQILMVGDNQHSDIEMAKKIKLSTYHLDRTSQIKIYKQFPKEMSKWALEQRLKLFSDECYKSFECFEPIVFSLFEFIEKLYESLVRKKVKDVFFLSREGEFLKKLFDFYQEFQGFGELIKINTHYLIVSRKSTFLPSLNGLDREDFKMLFRQYKRISLFDFLSSLNFGQADILNIANDLNDIDLHYKENDFPTSQTYKKLLNNSLFRECYESIRTSQYNNLIKYIDSFGANYFEDGLNIVDVGWKGTIQDNLFKLFDEKVVISGHYLGLVATGDLSKNNRKQGFVFSIIQSSSKYFDIYRRNTTIFEIILGASHGSADKYIILDEKPVASTYQEQEEAVFFQDIIKPIQDRVMTLFEVLCKLMWRSIYDIDEFKPILAKIHLRMVLFPNKGELSFFNTLTHFENFGIFEEALFSESKGLTTEEKIKNFIKLLSNPKKFLRNSHWIPINLYNSGLGFMNNLVGCYCYIRYFLLGG